LGADRLVGSFVLAVALISGCSAQPPSPPAPSPPTIQTLGILAEERLADPNRTYVLADGRTIDISLEQTRVLFDGGFGQPFVAGTDETGPFVAVFAHQDGLPDDCHVVPAGADGIERGGFIEIKGVLWRKALTFHSPETPNPGDHYQSGTRFCFDEQVQVASTVP
jgi:hypothetical protein